MITCVNDYLLVTVNIVWESTGLNEFVLILY